MYFSLFFVLKFLCRTPGIVFVNCALSEDIDVCILRFVRRNLHLYLAFHQKIWYNINCVILKGGFYMEIKRKIYDKLLDWKNAAAGKKALLIEGARRVGKSTAAEEFGKNEYKSYILIDFNKASKKVLGLCDDMTNLDTFFQSLSLEYGTRLYKRESLIIFDEIQRFPAARQMIKYLVADGRYDYLETGSLISIKENVDGITIPSEERKIKMYPLDFEEFASYLGEDVLLEYIADCYSKEIPLERAPGITEK